MSDYVGWKIVKECDDGSLIVESHTGAHRHIWQGCDEQAHKEIERLRITCDARGTLIDGMEAEIERLRAELQANAESGDCARRERDEARESAKWSQQVKDVIEERHRQDKKWGEQNHTQTVWVTILAEEMGEWSQDILHGNYSAARNELVQVAAVAIAAIESLDRNELKAR